MSATIRKLILQRLNYLFHGNQHGVSLGWIQKSNAEICESKEFLISKGHESDYVSELLSEGQGIYNKLVVNSKENLYSPRFDSGFELGCLLYAYVILEKPKIILETGVANGISTNLILSAIEKVGGTLHSFDLDPNVSQVYKGSADWKLHILRKHHAKKDLNRIVKNLDPVDLWLHDSNHGFQWQYFEYKLAKKKLSPLKSTLISDDIDASTAWVTFINENSLSSKMLLDKRKLVGIIEFKPSM